MKTSIDIPDEALSELLRHTGATTKREAILRAVSEFNQRQRQTALLRHAGKAEGMQGVAELQALRRRS